MHNVDNLNSNSFLLFSVLIKYVNTFNNTTFLAPSVLSAAFLYFVKDYSLVRAVVFLVLSEGRNSNFLLYPV